MENQLFQRFVSSMDALNTAQYRILKERISQRDEKRKTALKLSQNKRTICPRCKGSDLILWGDRSDLQRYMCTGCKRTFNELTNTPLARLRKKGKWLKFCECLLNGYSVRKAAEVCSIHRNTAFKWRHRFLQNPKLVTPKVLAGVVELIDYQLPYSTKGAKSKEKNTNKSVISSGSSSEPQLSESPEKPKKVTVIIARDRNKNTSDKIIGSLSSRELSNHFTPLINKDVLLCSNSKIPYEELSKATGLQHGKLKVEEGLTEYKDVVHINNLTNYVADLRKWMERFRGVATKYLDAYLGWYRNMEEFNFDLAPETLLLRAKRHSPYLHQP